MKKLIALLLLVTTPAWALKINGPLEGAKLEPLASDPPANQARVYYNTASKKAKISNGTVWSDLGSGGGGLYAGGQNLIANNSWEVDASGWTASGGSYARVTAAANIVPPGAGAASWDASASAQTLSASAVTIAANDGLSGRNGVLSCAVKTTMTDLKMQAYDGTNVISPNGTADVVPSSSAGFKRYAVNFTFPASGTIYPRFLSGGAGTAYIDDCYFGLAEGYNLMQVSQTQLYGTAFYPNASGCTWTGTLGASGSMNGNASCNFPTVTGNASSPAAKIPAIKFASLPPGDYEVIFTSRMTVTSGASGCQWRMWDGTNLSGHAESAATAGTNGQVLIGHFTYTTSQSNVTFQPYANPNTGSDQCAIQAVYSSEGAEFQVRYFPTTTQTAYKPDQTPASWSGYTTGAWTTSTPGSFVDFGSAASTVVEVRNRNFGTVTALTNLPGITFTPPRIGRYWACAMVSATLSGSANYAALQLVDGSGNSVGEGGFRTGTVGTSMDQTIPLCGILEAPSTAPVSLKIRGRSPNSVTLTVAVVYARGAVEWSIIELDAPMAMPLLVGGVQSSTSTAVPRFESATVIPTASTPTLVKQVGTWLNASTPLTPNAAGDVTLNFAVPFSDIPICGCVGNLNSTGVDCQVFATTTSSVRVQIFGTITGGLAAYQSNVWCHGLK